MMEDILDPSSVTTCENSGFNLLDTPGQSLTFSSDNYPSNYGKGTDCYWSFYAKNATQVIVTIFEFEVITLLVQHAQTRLIEKMSFQILKLPNFLV